MRQWFFLVVLSLVSNVHAAVFNVVDQQGNPLPDAVVELHYTPAVTAPPHPAEMAQKGLMFVPYVLAIPSGTYVDFPNGDKTRHHVYSFSEAKVFELKLYAGKPEQPILFDKPGIIVLGCNIHDHMQAYVYVGTSPFLGVTDAQGQVEISGLPATANYRLKLWHPWQSAEVPELDIAGGSVPPSLVISVQNQQKPKPPKRGFGQSY